MNKQRLFIITLALFLITLPTTLRAQIIKGEVFFGGNACQVDGDECYGFKKIGMHAGAGALVPITNWMDVSLEVLYGQKGAFKRDSITHNSTYPHRYNLKLNYAEIPVMIYVTDKDAVSFGIGASYGRIVGIDELIDRHSSGIGLGDGKLQWKDGYSGPDISQVEDINDLADIVYSTGVPDTIQIPAVIANSNTYRPSDFCICADLRFRVWEGFHIEARYQYSLRPIRTRMFYGDINETLPGEIRLQYNNLFTIRLVYIFNEHRSKVNKEVQKAKM